MRKSAGIVLFRLVEDQPQFFLVHPGGPYWKGKDAGAWSIPKGEFTDAEEPLDAAIREFREETGSDVSGPFIELAPVKQKAGKMVYAWAARGDMDATSIRSNTYRMEWPYKSGKWQSYPEVDEAAWFGLDEALEKINPAQAALLQQLHEILQSDKNAS